MCVWGGGGAIAMEVEYTCPDEANTFLTQGHLIVAPPRSFYVMGYCMDYCISKVIIVKRL